ncbi:hypothetical protein [Streptomyces sp. BK340]|uniref:hypothetical protein n=1 Tax=Streptomyces sp. BK340 TaxID=2572903 RepID=UPI0011A23023|nr:hypothetical protein [Streptomyces sp. BK340]
MNVFDATVVLLPGIIWLFLIMALLLILGGGLRYVMSAGDQGSISAAKNSILYGVMGSGASAIALLAAYLLHNPSLGETFRGMGAGGVLSAAAWLILSGAYIPKAVASYSAWWMPVAERAAHRQDMLFALSRVRWGTRSRHAWGLLTSSPRAGLRARRYTARLEVKNDLTESY